MAITERIERVNLHNGKGDFSILQISDIHLWFSIKKLEDIHTIITVNNPNLIVLTGDYYDIPKGAHNFRAFLLDISKRHIVVFIKGNHDTIFGTKTSNLLLDIPNCICVEDSIYRHQSKLGHFYNITSWENRNNLPFNTEDKNIILIHNPEKIKRKQLSNIHVILAGHLHGGQFIFFKMKNNSNFPGCLLYKNCTDRKQIDTTVLIVSKGLGDTFPFRYNCSKEIVHIKIE